MSGKGAKDLIMGKPPSPAAAGSKDKKRSVTRSSRVGLQVVLITFIYVLYPPAIFST